MSLREWTFHLRVVTPMAMSGADPSRAEWRAASVKGLIRWWFRVAGGSRADEDRLFGYVRGDKPQASPLKVETFYPSFSPSTADPPAPYFGFSIKINKRPMIPVNTRLEARFRVEPWVSDEDLQKIQAAIGLTFYLGNFGTRSRKGYGSLIIERLEPSTLMEEFPPLTSSQDSINAYSQLLSRYLNVLRGPGLCIDGILHVNAPWRSLEQSYKAFRKRLGIPHKAFLGYPFHPNEPSGGTRWPERYASPLIIKPLSQDGPCIVTVLLVPKDVEQSFGGSQRPNLKQYSKKLDQFLNSIRAHRLWPPLG